MFPVGSSQTHPCQANASAPLLEATSSPLHLRPVTVGAPKSLLFLSLGAGVAALGGAVILTGFSGLLAKVLAISLVLSLGVTTGALFVFTALVVLGLVWAYHAYHVPEYTATQAGELNHPNELRENDPKYSLLTANAEEANTTSKQEETVAPSAGENQNLPAPEQENVGENKLRESDSKYSPPAANAEQKNTTLEQEETASEQKHELLLHLEFERVQYLLKDKKILERKKSQIADCLEETRKLRAAGESASQTRVFLKNYLFKLGLDGTENLQAQEVFRDDVYKPLLKLIDETIVFLRKGEGPLPVPIYEKLKRIGKMMRKTKEDTDHTGNALSRLLRKSRKLLALLKKDPEILPPERCEELEFAINRASEKESITNGLSNLLVQIGKSQQRAKSVPNYHKGLLLNVLKFRTRLQKRSESEFSIFVALNTIFTQIEEESLRKPEAEVELEEECEEAGQEISVDRD